MTDPARDAVLDRIRRALADIPPDERPADVPVPRAYRRSLGLDPAPTLDLFAERVADYRASVHRLPPVDLAAAIAATLARRGVHRLAVPTDLPTDWRPNGIEVVDDTGLTAADLDGCDGVLTGCAVAIAETGTIVLDAGARQGRRMLTLVPDYHLCVMSAGQVARSVPEALGRLVPTRPTTFVSGPSANSDIELNRVEGVHGPRTLDVLLVG